MSTKFEDYLNALHKEQTSKNILKLLSSIRNEVDWPKNQQNIHDIRERGCLKHLVNILKSQHKQILNVCLSILGNCIMDRDSAREAIGLYNILSALSHVLKRFKKEDSINGRVFRILGNLCHHNVDYANLIIDKKPQIIKHLLELLISSSNDENEEKDKWSEATILMAIRSLRYLINQYTVKTLKTTFPVFNALGSLFIKTSQEWQKNQTNENILNDIITLFYNLSRYKDYTMILELKKTSKGDALEHLANVLLLCPKKVIKIIMNLIRISKLKSDLPVSDICNKFVEEIVKKNINTQDFKSECLDYIKCLCYLMEDPANRNGYQCSKVIPLLIEVLKQLDVPTEIELECCCLLINTLNKCQFEENLVQEQLKCNILDVLVNKLQWIMGDSGILSLKHTFKGKLKKKSSALVRKLDFGAGDMEIYGKRKVCSCWDCLGKNNSYSCSSLHSTSFSGLQSNLIEEISRQRQLSPLSSDDDSGYNSKFDRSPSPCSSSSSDFAGLSWASPCASPRSLNNDISYSDSDDYSPVCSEADSTEFPLNAMVEIEASEEDQHEFTEVEENPTFVEALEERSISSLKIKLIFEIAKLIKSYINISPPVLQLGSENLLLALLNCSDFYKTKHPNCITTVNVVCDILHSHIYLIPLMKTALIEKIYSLTEFIHTNNCVVCSDHSDIGELVLKRLTSLAECAAGKGDIAHELLTGTIDVKKQIVLVMPYIVENKTILSKLLLNCGGLNILMQLLKEEGEYKNRTIRVICALASKKLEIANPKKVAIDDKIRVFNTYQSDDHINMVTFKLDDGKCVQADRDYLTEKSDYFSSLLNGHFKESKEDEICLHNVKFKTLNCLLRLVECINILENVEIDTLLDVIALSDRYLLSEICSFVTNYVEKYRISSKTVPVIYRWSLESGLNLLRVESIAFALVAKVIYSTRCVMFNELFKVGYSEELVGDIQTLLVRYLKRFSL